MKTVIRGIDDIVYRLQLQKEDGTEFLLSDFDDFEIAVFTDDMTRNYIVENEYIDADDNIVRIPANKIADVLNDGIIRLHVLTAISDEKFPDGKYSQTNIVDTNYFLKTVTE